MQVKWCGEVVPAGESVFNLDADILHDIVRALIKQDGCL
jgi:hypothetical protein